MKNISKNRSHVESFSATEAAALLGVSVPTLKRMVAEDRLESFRTPGGHLRILAESVDTLRESKRERFRPVRDASPVLQNRRERLEELTLEAQEIRARRELAKLEREEQDEAEQQQAEEEERQQEAAERESELELERERLEQQRAEDRRNKEAEREQAAFRCRWIEFAYQALRLPECAWLSEREKKEIMEILESEIEKRRATDEPRMVMVLGQAIAASVERYQAERRAREQRHRVIRAAVGTLSIFATEQQKASATKAARDAVARLDATADESEMRTAAEAAIGPVDHAVERRLVESRALNWAIQQLPQARTELDAARVRRECAEILAELPDVSEEEAKEALDSTIREACQEIETCQARQQRQTRKAHLVEHGLAAISAYLLELKSKGEITAQEYFDADFTEHITTAVRRTLQAELTGDESNKEVGQLTREIIDSEV